MIQLFEKKILLIVLYNFQFIIHSNEHIWNVTSGADEEVTELIWHGRGLGIWDKKKWFGNIVLNEQTHFHPQCKFDKSLCVSSVS